LDKSGRTVKLSWQAPYNGNSNLTRYMIEFKQSKGTWKNDIDHVLVPGDQVSYTLSTKIIGNVRVGQIIEFIESIGAMLTAFYWLALPARGINKDPTVGLDCAWPHPKYVLKIMRVLQT
jgi:hypothetical protein